MKYQHEITNFLRNYNDKRIKPTLSREGNTVIDILIKAHKEINRKIISKICHGLQKQNKTNTGYIKAKWERELNIEISDKDWQSMWNAQHSSTSSKNWRIFGW